MAKLSDDERKLLDELQAKADAPDDDGGKRGDVNVFVDLSDDNAVRRALKLRVLDKGDLDEFDDGGDDDGGDGDDDGDDDDDGGDDDGKKRRRDAAPRRRLTMADRMMGANGDD